jgi:hypothetical protein
MLKAFGLNATANGHRKNASLTGLHFSLSILPFQLRTRPR